MSRKALPIGLVLVAIALLLGRLQRFPSLRPAPSRKGSVAEMKPSVPVIRGKPVANFALPNLDGKLIQRADFQNKVLLVNFWATWCAPCLIEIPWFVEFQEQYGPQGLEVIGISLDEGDIGKVKEFVQKHGMNYTVAMGDDKAAEAFGGIIGLPTTFLVDRAGKYYSRHQGLVGRDIVEEELIELLGPPRSPQAGSLKSAPADAPRQPAVAPPSAPAPAVPSPRKG